MVNPVEFTNYNRSDIELEECLLFSLLVAGKNALTTSRMLDNFLKCHTHLDITPFKIFEHFDVVQLTVTLRDFGFGCYNIKAKGIHQLVRANLNLRTCTVDDLEAIYCIGMKTSRLFVLHNRPNANCIPLDIHILHFLRDSGYDVPSVTPSSKKKYLVIEEICRSLAKKAGKTLADWDLTAWRFYSKRAS